jgi:hypothetical protein
LVGGITVKKLLASLGLAALAASGFVLHLAWAVDSATYIGNANYSILNTDVRLVPNVALTANRTWTLPYAAGTNIGQGNGPASGPGGATALDIVDTFGNIGGSNSCIVIAPQSGDLINNSSSSVTFCTTYGVATLRPMSGNNWVLSVPPTQAGQTPGTATNDNANAGNVGEFITSNIPIASAVQATTNSSINITSVSLTPGDWDCRATMSESISPTTTVQQLSASIAQTTSVLGTQGTDGTMVFSTKEVSAILLGAQGTDLKMGPARQSLASTTTVYLVEGATFATSQLWVYGSISCRRAR